MHRWPSLIVAAILSLYWSRVLWMARKSRKRAGQAAHFLPPEPMGLLLRFVWIPLVGLWIGLPWLDAFRRHPTGLLQPFYESPAIAWAGASVAAAALVVTWTCWKKMGRHWRMGIDPAEKTELLETGPWAHVRHPIYALSSVLMLATLAVVPNTIMLAVAATHLALLQWEARREEKYLAAAHGDAYRAYCSRVARFIPRF